MVASDGGIFTFGDARFHGSLGGNPPSAPIVGIATTPDGGDYWLLSSSGQIFSFGDATFIAQYGHTFPEEFSGITGLIGGYLVAPSGDIGYSGYDSTSYGDTYGSKGLYSADTGEQPAKPVAGIAAH